MIPLDRMPLLVGSLMQRDRPAGADLRRVGRTAAPGAIFRRKIVARLVTKGGKGWLGR